MARPARPGPGRLLANIVHRRLPEVGNPVIVIHGDALRGEGVPGGRRHAQGDDPACVSGVSAQKKRLGHGSPLADVA